MEQRFSTRPPRRDFFASSTTALVEEGTVLGSAALVEQEVPIFEVTLRRLDDRFEIECGRPRSGQLEHARNESDLVESSSDGLIRDVSELREERAREVEVTEVDGESQTLYGTRSMRIDLKLLDSDDDGRNIARYELVRRSQPRGLVKSVRLSNKPANDDKKIDLGMASRIAIQDAKTQHDDEYFIIGEKHVYTREGQHEVTWIVELASSSRAWLLGVTGYSELGINTYLGF